MRLYWRFVLVMAFGFCFCICAKRNFILSVYGKAVARALCEAVG